jgi:hypothetical protein
MLVFGYGCLLNLYKSCTATNPGFQIAIEEWPSDEWMKNA